MKNELAQAKRPWIFFVIFLVTLPPSILWCWPLVLLVRLFFGQKLHWVDWGLWTEIRRGSWLAGKMKYSGVTFGSGGIAKAGKLGVQGVVDTLLEYHEQKHVHQSQVMQLMVTVLVIFAHFVCGANYLIFAVIPFGWVLAYLCAMTVSALRGDVWYRMNIFEESAYAQTAIERQGKGLTEIERLARYLTLNLGGEIIEGSAVDTTIACLNKWRRLSQAPELGDDYQRLRVRRSLKGIG